MIRRMLAISAAGVLAAGMAVGASSANADENWPTGPLTMLIGYGADGGTTTKGRVLANVLSEKLGQQINILNRPGGGQSVALMQFASERPTGDMFFFGSISGLSMQPQLNKALTYSRDDFEYAGGVTEYQPAMVAPMDRPYTSMEELVAWAKEGNRVRFASLYPPARMAMEIIAETAGIENFTVVPTRSGGETSQLLISGQVDFAFSGGQHASFPDDIRVLAANTTDRLQTAPDVPTLKELGYPVVLDAWGVVLFPKGTPESILARMEEALEYAATHPDLIRISDATKYPIRFRTREDARQAVEDAYESFRSMVEATGFEPS